jgi:hypothetical protein
MANKKWLIDANALIKEAHWVIRSDGTRVFVVHAEDVDSAEAVDAVEVSRIEEVKQTILQTFDNIIAIHRDISNSPMANSARYLDIPESSNDYNGIYADAMEVARRLVNAALTDLCESSSSGMRGNLNDVY